MAKTLRSIWAGPVQVHSLSSRGRRGDPPSVRAARHKASSEAQKRMNRIYSYQRLELLLAANFPAAGSAASRRSSAWIWSPDGERVCMTCGGPASFTLTGTGWIEAPYCQTCGARMNFSRKD